MHHEKPVYTASAVAGTERSSERTVITFGDYYCGIYFLD